MAGVGVARIPTSRSRPWFRRIQVRSSRVQRQRFKHWDTPSGDVPRGGMRRRPPRWSTWGLPAGSVPLPGSTMGVREPRDRPNSRPTRQMRCALRPGLRSVGPNRLCDHRRPLEGPATEARFRTAPPGRTLRKSPRDNSSDLKLSAVSTDIRRLPADALVLAWRKGTDGTAPAGLAARRGGDRVLEASLNLLGISGAADELTLLPSTAETQGRGPGLIGLGDVEAAPLTEEALRRAAGSATRQLAGTPGALRPARRRPWPRPPPRSPRASPLGAYAFTNHRSRPRRPTAPLAEAVIATAATPRSRCPRR